MNIKIIFLLLLVSFILCGDGNAQPCSKSIKKGLLKGKTYTAECDSMIVLDKATYEGLYNKIFFDEAIIRNQDRLDSLMRSESSAKDSLIQNLETKISIQGEAIKEYRSKIDTLYTLSEKTFALNDKAIRALEKEKKKNKLGKIGMFTLGGFCLFMVGVIAAGAL